MADDGRTLPARLRAWAALHGERPALGWTRAWRGRSLSHAGLARAASTVAANLKGAGLQRGERVLLLMEPRPEWACALFGLWEAGLVAVPAPPSQGSDATADLAHRVGVRGTVFGTEGHESAVGRLMPIESLLHGPPAAPTPPCDLALVALTSGTTGRPRGVEVTHANLLADLDALLQVRRSRRGDALLSMLHPSHLFELVGGLLGPLACGSRVVYPGTLLPNRLVASLKEDRITHALAVPALLECLGEALLDDCCPRAAAGRDGKPLASWAAASLADPARLEPARAALRARIGDDFRELIVGGAAIDPSWADVLEPLGIDLEVGYGLTEAGPIVSVGRALDGPRGSVGRPLPGVEVRIGGGGEILVRGPNVVRGYWDDEEATERALGDGWLRSGDRGHVDADGHLFVDGRLKDAMVTAAGLTLQPEALERHYHSPAFAEACVAGVPGPDGNDVPTLFVVPASPEADVEGAFAALQAAAPLGARIERCVRLEAPLPRTATGKLRRRELARAGEPS